jgi:hypothetical protein
MNFQDIGPLQVMVVGFDSDAEFDGLVIDELERLTARGLIRVIDLQFITKGAGDKLAAVEFSALEEEEAAEFGMIIGQLMGMADPTGDEIVLVDDASEKSFGLGVEDLVAIGEDLEAGESVGVLLFEHTWASELKAAVRESGGFPIAQGLLTPEAMMMVGSEVLAIAEAEATIELADAVAGAAVLDAIATVEAAEDVKAMAAVDTVRALMASGLIIDAAAQEALDALVAAELITEMAIESAAAVVESDALELSQALESLEAAEASS